MTADREIDIDTALGGRPAVPSLFEATSYLEQVVAAVPSFQPWYAELRHAIQTCALAVESELDSLSGSDGRWGEVTRDQPRLIPQIERLKTTLNGLLVDLWEAKGDAVPPDTDLIRAMRRLSSAMHHAASKDIDIFYEWLVPIGGED